MLMVLALSGMSAFVLLSAGADAAVARNESWAVAAAAQAEAGLELAKALLAAHVASANSFEPVLPPVRGSIRVGADAPWGTARPEDAGACPDPGRASCRDYESFLDETVAGGRSRIYVGRVLRDTGGRALQFDPRDPDSGWAPDLDGDGTSDVSGVTVWVRRPVIGSGDAADHDRAVLTAEARHPLPSRPGDPHAVSRLELTLRLARRPGDGEDDGGDYSDTLTNWARSRGAAR